jgi:hypothetical protein
VAWLLLPWWWLLRRRLWLRWLLWLLLAWLLLMLLLLLLLVRLPVALWLPLCGGMQAIGHALQGDASSGFVGAVGPRHAVRQASAPASPPGAPARGSARAPLGTRMATCPW